VHDHPGPRADITTIPPATTTEIPGGARRVPGLYRPT
jgi:hypothetical protein